MSIVEVLNKAKHILIENEIDEREARLLLAHSLGISKEKLIAINEISKEDAEYFLNLVDERIKGKPYAYIVGHKEFMGHDFIVDNNVLIPREDSEVLVQTVIDIIIQYGDQKIDVLDMCTGSRMHCCIN